MFRPDFRQFPRHFMDLETTSLDPESGEIIEIAIITEDHKGKLSSFAVRVHPAYLERADPKSLEINGYDPELWRGAPCFSEISDKVARILRYGIIIGHNVQFDYQFLKAALGRCGDPRITHRRIDTQILALEHLPFASVSMGALRDWFGWSHEYAHTATQDAEDCMRLFRLFYRCSSWRRALWWFRWRWREHTEKTKKAPS